MSNENYILHAEKQNKLANYSFIAGYTGALIIVFLAYLAAKFDVRAKGWNIFSLQLTDNFYHSAFLVLGFTALIMFSIELIIRKKIERNIITISPKLLEKKYVGFVLECLFTFLLEICVLYLAVMFYKYANEFGYTRKSAYYQPFFALIKIFWNGYFIVGFPYIFITRALQYDPLTDRKEPAYLLFKILMKIAKRTPIPGLFAKINFYEYTNDSEFNTFHRTDKTNILGIFVKMFFVPVITVFFINQFQHLINNWSYITGTLSKTFFTNFMTTIDFYNLSHSVIFTIDVGVAWCGYVVSSRWIKNSNVSTEPSFLGWFVAISCYPPFQFILSAYFPIPAENGYLSIPHPKLVAIFTIMSIFSYTVYMLATVYIGIRFSNLTHRGIVRRGPYALVRHPAYASKNFSWWCVMMPNIIYQAIAQNSMAVLVQILGLIFMTFFYYMRAITEERHLSADPDYQEYCKQVPYRFIPKVL